METLTAESVEALRSQQVKPESVIFRVTALYGLCPEGVKVPLGAKGLVNSGPVAVTIDPDADLSCNLGVVDFGAHKLKVRYGVQAVFPALHDLVTSGGYDH